MQRLAGLFILAGVVSACSPGSSTTGSSSAPFTSSRSGGSQGISISAPETVGEFVFLERDQIDEGDVLQYEHLSRPNARVSVFLLPSVTVEDTVDTIEKRFQQAKEAVEALQGEEGYEEVRPLTEEEVTVSVSETTVHGRHAEYTLLRSRAEYASHLYLFRHSDLVLKVRATYEAGDTSEVRSDVEEVISTFVTRTHPSERPTTVSFDVPSDLSGSLSDEQLLTLAAVIQRLEQHPLAEGADEARLRLFKWIQGSPDVSITICSGLLQPIVKNETTSSRLFLQQYILSTAAAKVRRFGGEDQNEGDAVEDHVSGVEGGLQAYQVVSAEAPQQMTLDYAEMLLQKREEDALREFLSDRAEACLSD